MGADRHSLGVLVWSPLSMRLLSGRYRKESASPGTDLGPIDVAYEPPHLRRAGG